MAKQYGLDFSWGTNITCNKCKGEIVAFPSVIKEKYARYGFRCDGCNISGDWEDFVRGYFEARRRSADTASKKIVAPKQF